MCLASVPPSRRGSRINRSGAPSFALQSVADAVKCGDGAVGCKASIGTRCLATNNQSARLELIRFGEQPSNCPEPKALLFPLLAFEIAD